MGNLCLRGFIKERSENVEDLMKLPKKLFLYYLILMEV